jgi:4-hydroxy-2-oxoheptanedioate aldolase
MDLTYGLGLSPGDFSSEQFTDALERIKASCREHKLVCGIFGYNATMAAQSLDEGFDFASIGSDISFLREGCNRALATARGEEAEADRGGY